jgi:hypothetical protein
MPNILTICPESLRAQANNLAGVVGKSMADLQTFDKAPRVEKGGIQYRWANAQCPESLFAKLSGGLPLPHYDDGTLDATAANTILAGALIVTPAMLEQDAPTVSNRLVIAPNMEPQAVLGWLGMMPVAED